MNRHIRSRRFWVGLVSGLIAAVISLWAVTGMAQDEEDFSDAYLNVQFALSGTITVDLAGNLQDAAPLDALTDSLNQLVGCPLQDISSDVFDGWWQFHGSCDRAFSNQDWLISRTFNLDPLLQQLRSLQITSLTLDLAHPRTGFTQLTPAIVSPQADRQIYYTQKLDLTHTAITSVDVTFGYRPIDIVGIVVPLGCLLLLPICLVLLMRRRALRATVSDPAPIWFGYQRSLVWISIGLWVGWVSLIWGTGVDQFLNFVLDDPLIPRTLLHSGLFLVPPVLVIVLCYALSHSVFQRVGSTTWTRNDLIQQAVWSQLHAFLPLTLFLSGFHSTLDGNVQVGIAYFAIAVIAHSILTRLVLKSQDITLHALSMGELRDRVFALAQPAGVQLQQVYVLPTGRGRMANAFAVRGGNVMFTEYLLQHLSKREVDAVIAHELAHLQFKHPQALLTILALTMVGVMTATAIAAQWLIWLPWFPLSVVLTLIVFYFYSRRFEHQADLQSAVLTSDPTAMITALVKLSRLNLMPLEWSKRDELLLTHPSMRKRAQTIALRHQIPADQLELLLKPDDKDTDRYTLPPALSNNQPIFSTTVKQGMCQRIAWALILVLTVTPAVIAWMLQRLAVSAGVQWLFYLTGAIATYALLLMVLNVLPVQGYDRLRHQLAQKLQAQGMDVDAWKGQFVGLSPEALPRIYEGFWNWDIGFVLLNGDRLCYLGEQTQFSLSRHHITEIRLGHGTVGWWRSPYLYITWHDQATQTSGTFNLCPHQVQSLRQVKLGVRNLKQQIDHWHEQNSTEPTPQVLATLPLPQFGTVTSRSIHDLVNLQQLITYLLLLIPVAIGIGLLLQLPFTWQGIGYTVLVTGLGAVVQMLPIWGDRLSQK